MRSGCSGKEEALQRRAIVSAVHPLEMKIRRRPRKGQTAVHLEPRLNRAGIHSKPLPGKPAALFEPHLGPARAPQTPPLDEPPSTPSIASNSSGVVGVFFRARRPSASQLVWVGPRLVQENCNTDGTAPGSWRCFRGHYRQRDSLYPTAGRRTHTKHRCDRAGRHRCCNTDGNADTYSGCTGDHSGRRAGYDGGPASYPYQYSHADHHTNSDTHEYTYGNSDSYTSSHQDADRAPDSYASPH